MRQLWRALRRVPQLLLVQPEQLGYDLAYALALLPLVIAGILFFLQDAILVFAIAFLAGIVCLLAVQLARLTFGLPAWVGFKASHPLVASILIACFFSPRTPAWVVASMVILFVVLDTLVWAQLQRLLRNAVAFHPALIVFGLTYLLDRQLGVGLVNPFDGRPLDDPLTLWYRLMIIVDPVKLYVGNIPGPVGATSAGAVLLGFTYLWYTRKVSLGVFGGFALGIAAVAMALRSDLGFQLASGPALFAAGYIAADRRRVMVPERFTLLTGIGGGVVTMLLRWYGLGYQSVWMGLLFVGLVATLALWMRGMLKARARRSGGGPTLRRLPIESGDREVRPVLAPVRSEAPQPVMASANLRTSGYQRPAIAASTRRFDTQHDPNDLVRQMRLSATQGQTWGPQTALLLGSLLLINPVGLWLTWKTRSMAQQVKLMLSAVSVLWYLGVAGLAFALLHR